MIYFPNFWFSIDAAVVLPTVRYLQQKRRLSRLFLAVTATYDASGSTGDQGTSL